MAMQSRTGSRFSVTARGYDPRAVQSRMAELTHARMALEDQARDLERQVRAVTEPEVTSDESPSNRFVEELSATLRGAYSAAEEIRRSEQDRAQAECSEIRAVMAAHLASVDEEAQRAQTEAAGDARRLVADTALAAEQIRTEAARAATARASEAGPLVESARMQATQRTNEVITELESEQRGAEQLLEAAQREAETRLEAAHQEMAVAIEAAGTTMAAAEGEAARIREQARQEAAGIETENQTAVAELRQASERIATTLEINLRSAAHFSDGLLLTTDEPADQAAEPVDAATDSRPGLLAEVVSLLPRRKIRCP